jgi:hypothetical protein
MKLKLKSFWCIFALFALIPSAHALPLPRIFIRALIQAESATELLSFLRASRSTGSAVISVETSLRTRSELQPLHRYLQERAENYGEFFYVKRLIDDRIEFSRIPDPHSAGVPPINYQRMRLDTQWAHLSRAMDTAETELQAVPRAMRVQLARETLSSLTAEEQLLLRDLMDLQAQDFGLGDLDALSPRIGHQNFLSATR